MEIGKIEQLLSPLVSDGEKIKILEAEYEIIKIADLATLRAENERLREGLIKLRSRVSIQITASEGDKSITATIITPVLKLWLRIIDEALNESEVDDD